MAVTLAALSNPSNNIKVRASGLTRDYFEAPPTALTPTKHYQ